MPEAAKTCQATQARLRSTRGGEGEPRCPTHGPPSTARTQEYPEVYQTSVCPDPHGSATDRTTDSTASGRPGGTPRRRGGQTLHLQGDPLTAPGNKA